MKIKKYVGKPPPSDGKSFQNHQNKSFLAKKHRKIMANHPKLIKNYSNLLREITKLSIFSPASAAVTALVKAFPVVWTITCHMELNHLRLQLYHVAYISISYQFISLMLQKDLHYGMQLKSWSWRLIIR